MDCLHTRRFLVQIFGASTLTVATSGWRNLQAQDTAIVATTFGARPDGTDAAPGFARAIAELVRRGGGRLVVPRGTYTFTAESGICLAFDSLANVAIEADGAEFIFRGLARPLAFRNCHNVRLTGLTIRWARPPFSQGDVVYVASDHLSAIIALDAITPSDRWTQVEAFGEYERATGLIARRGLDVYGAVTTVEPISYGHVKLHFNRGIPLTSGKTLVLRHAIYEAHAVEMRGCSDVLIENITIRSAPGMAFVAGLTRNITVRQCEVAPPPTSGLFMSTTADAIHFGNCSGEVLIEGNRFAKMGDDGVNVLTSYWRIIQRPDERSMIVSQRLDQKFWSDDKPSLGDAFKVASAGTLTLIGEARVDETHLVGPIPAPAMELHFNQQVSGSFSDLIYNEVRSPQIIIRDNKFEDNRARGVLVHKNALIEKNLFQNQAAQGLLLVPDAWWMEGPEISNVRILGNTFNGIDRWELEKGAITIDVDPLKIAEQSTGSFNSIDRAISISGNIFLNFKGPPITSR